jgi:hypothetical protein
MKRALLLLFVLGCDKGEPPPQPPKPAPIPPGPYVVAYGCQHPDARMRSKAYSRSSFDLGKRTHSSSRWWGDVYRPKPEWADPPMSLPRPEPLAPDRVTEINAAVEKVLSGGPYKPEPSPDVGASCELVILSNGNELLRIEKAVLDERDAVSALVQTLHP